MTNTEEIIKMLKMLKESAIADKLNTKIEGIRKKSFDFIIDVTINKLKALTEEGNIQ